MLVLWIHILSPPVLSVSESIVLSKCTTQFSLHLTGAQFSKLLKIFLSSS